MKLLSVKNDKALCEKVKAYCKENWHKVYDSFAYTADRSVTAERFPQTWVIFGHHYDEYYQYIVGFYQLDEHDHLTVHTELTPFITTLFIDPGFRGGYRYGETAVTHAREILGSMGYDTAYLHTDLIGYYEKYGFSETGLDITDYGSPTKVYCADTLTDIRYEVYDKSHPKPDHVRLAIYQLQDPFQASAAEHLWFNKCNGFTEWWKAKCFTIAAFNNERVVGAVNFFQSPENPSNWELGDLHVAEGFRRRGIASKMLHKGLGIIKRTANGGEFVYAYIEKDNEASVGLHKKLGFTDTGEIRPFNEFLFGDDETTWIKYLSV